jgi:hypothetical protein
LCSHDHGPAACLCLYAQQLGSGHSPPRSPVSVTGASLSVTAASCLPVLAPEVFSASRAFLARHAATRQRTVQ